MLLCVACQFKFKVDNKAMRLVTIERFDRLESRYLTTGDFSALQQMNTDYPIETRTLIENVLKLGAVYEPDINSRFLNFYQDTVLQSVISEVGTQYANMKDVSEDMNMAFSKLIKIIPNLKIPVVYTQIGAFDQSIIVGDSSIGISLDKYLGSDYALYKKYYSKSQLKSMTRSYIVPDVICFYLFSLYPMKNFDSASQQFKDLHAAKVMWITNQIVERDVFDTKFIKAVDMYMKANKKTSYIYLLRNVSYKNLAKYLAE